MTFDYDKWLAEFHAEQQQRHAQLPAVKDAIIRILKRRRISQATIDYDGEGDSGQIAGIAVDGASPDSTRKIVLNVAGERRHYASLQEALDTFAWQVLEVYHAGFENNEGGYGTIRIDCRRAIVTVDHNDRIIDVVNDVEEL